MEQYGDRLPREISQRIAPPIADTTALQALPADQRVDGRIIVKLDDDTVWLFDAASSAGASSTVIVPDAGTGRWLKLAVSDGVSASDLASTANAKGASLIGIEDSAAALAAATVEAALAELAALRVQKKTVTVGHADLTAAATSEAINIGTALPANARIWGREIRLATAFSGGGAGAVSVDIGGTDADAVVDGESVFTGATTAKAGTSGINPFGKLGGQQLTATFISDVNVADLTAGSVVIDVLYVVLP